MNVFTCKETADARSGASSLRRVGYLCRMIHGTIAELPVFPKARIESRSAWTLLRMERQWSMSSKS